MKSFTEIVDLVLNRIWLLLGYAVLRVPLPRWRSIAKIAAQPNRLAGCGAAVKRSRDSGERGERVCNASAAAGQAAFRRRLFFGRVYDTRILATDLQ